MMKTIVLGAAHLAVGAATPQGAMKMKKVTTVLTVESIEPSLKFWVDKLGYTRTVEVPDGDRLAFVILEKGGTELMFQTLKSLKASNSNVASRVGSNKAMLYIEVERLDAILPALDGLDVLMPRHTTFYGADEISIVEPGGHFIIFAQPKKE